MTAHFYSLTLKGKNLKPHDDDEIIKVLNSGQEDKFFDGADVYQGKDRIVVTVESKWIKYNKVFKSISKKLKDVDSVFAYCEPYWNTIRMEGLDLDLIIWARAKADRKRLWDDARVSRKAYSPWPPSQRKAYDKFLKDQCEENGTHFYEYEERVAMDSKMDSEEGYEYPDDYDPELYESGLEYPYSSDFQSYLVDDLIKKFNNEPYDYHWVDQKLPDNA